jgi:PleD family two-component response regulator
VTASIGLTDVRPGDTADQVMARADQAMYAAKRLGPGQLAVSRATEATS